MKTILPLLALALQLAPVADALTINVTFDADLNTSYPPADPDGAELTRLMQVAADYWEDIIEDPGTLDIVFFYDDTIGPSAFFRGDVNPSSGNIPSGVIRFNIAANNNHPSWWFDPTPLDNSEYAMEQVYYRDLTATEKSQQFRGTPPDLLEVAYEGPAIESAANPANDVSDMFTYCLHELGHALGMAGTHTDANVEASDGDYDLEPGHLNGAVCAAIQDTDGGHHVECNQCLMNTSIGGDRRKLPSARDVLAIAVCNTPTWAPIDLSRQEFLPGGTNVWNTPGNWVSGYLPGAADAATIQLGTFGNRFTVDLTANAAAGSLRLVGVNEVHTGPHKLDLTTAAEVSNDYFFFLPNGETNLQVDAGGEVEVPDLLLSGGSLVMNGGVADIQDDLTISNSLYTGNITGRGNVSVTSDLFNDGEINGDGGILVFSTPNPANNPWDLDGNGQGAINAIDGDINFLNGTLNDAYDGTLTVAGGRTFTFAQPWTLDAVFGTRGTIDLQGTASAAVVAGGVISSSGGLLTATGLSRLTAPVDFGSGVDVILTSTLANNRLEFDADTTITGSTFEVPANTVLSFESTTSLRAPDISGAGETQFEGPVIIDLATTIATTRFDFDGNNAGDDIHTLNESLTITSTAIDDSNNSFDDTLRINGTALLDLPNVSSWTMNGDLEISSGLPTYPPSITGAPLTLSGTATITDSTSWESRLNLPGTINLPSPSDSLDLAGGSLSNPNTITGGTIAGPGSLRASGNARLVGRGSISAAINFQGPESGAHDTGLFASGGTLSLSGGLLNLPPHLGTLGADANLVFANNLNLTAGDSLTLDGGMVSAPAISNSTTISGHGTVSSGTLNNLGHLSADGDGILVLATTSPIDLDGTTSPQTHSVNAIDGDLVITSSLADSFDAALNIGPARSATFQQAWTLNTSGIVNLTGGDIIQKAARLEGSRANLGGTIHVSGLASSAAELAFLPSSSTSLAASAELNLQNSATVAAGAALTGIGTLKVDVIPGNTLTLGKDCAIDVPLLNLQRLVLGATGAPIAYATLASYAEGSAASIHLDIGGRPADEAHDQLFVTNTADLDGSLHINFAAPSALPGDIWTLITAGELTGAFRSISATGLPPETELVALQTPTSLSLKLVSTASFSTWAAALALPSGLDGPKDDPDLDNLPNALEMLLGSDPNSPDPELAPQAGTVIHKEVEHLALTVTLTTLHEPKDYFFQVSHSTDLLNWSVLPVTLHSTLPDPLNCTETRVYRSDLPYGSVPVEFLRYEAVPRD